jgi:hypothetical protein
MAAWTTYGRQQMLLAASGAIPVPTLYVALYQASADPASSPVELALSNYARQRVSFVADPSTAGLIRSAFDVNFPNLGAGSFLGQAVLDDPLAGGVWWWADQGTAVTIPAGSSVDFPSGQITASV